MAAHESERSNRPTARDLRVDPGPLVPVESGQGDVAAERTMVGRPAQLGRRVDHRGGDLAEPGDRHTEHAPAETRDSRTEHGLAS